MSLAESPEPLGRWPRIACQCVALIEVAGELKIHLRLLRNGPMGVKLEPVLMTSALGKGSGNKRLD